MLFNFYLVKGDTLPSLTAGFAAPDGTKLDITGCTVEFLMRPANPITAAPVVNYAPAVSVDAVNGEVRYDWTASDVAVAGHYYGRFRVTFPSGRKLHLPNKETGFLISISEA